MRDKPKTKRLLFYCACGQEFTEPMVNAATVIVVCQCGLDTYVDDMASLEEEELPF